MRYPKGNATRLPIFFYDELEISSLSHSRTSVSATWSQTVRVFCLFKTKFLIAVVSLSVADHEDDDYT